MTARHSNALTPVPSWIRASAWDAGNMHMRKAGRAKWNIDDWNVAAATQDRLIKGCYGRASDHNEPNLCYIRFSLAEQMEKAGRFPLRGDMRAAMAEIDAVLS
jgi:hypothetical protein